MFGYTTIQDGHHVVVWDDKTGKRELVHGPARIPTWGKRVDALKTFMAGPTQYLIVQHRDGRMLHQRGPAMAWMDPVQHAGISVADAITLDANEALVVYRQADDGKVQRRVVRGPEMFVPEAQEWLHEFRWHGADPRDPRKKIPRGLCFTKLRVIPDQMYFDVESVRTCDDALLTIKLMIFYELMDIALMLDQTHDPIADFINAVTADVIDFAAGMTFEQFKEQTERLNVRETYPQLAQRAGRIGYRINKVVYRGYEATAKLQAMHDNAIETRTRLKLEAETEQQAQSLADLKLTREQEREHQRQAMQQANVEHDIRIKRAGHDEQLRQHQVEAEAKLRQQQAEAEIRLKQQLAIDEQKLTTTRQQADARLHQREAAYQQRVTFLKSVQDLQVDMTRYLVAKHERPDRRIRLEGDRRAQLHLHEG